VQRSSEAARPVGTLWQRLPAGARGLTVGDESQAPSVLGPEEDEEEAAGTGERKGDESEEDGPAGRLEDTANLQPGKLYITRSRLKF
jgi:hypothetical protein